MANNFNDIGENAEVIVQLLMNRKLKKNAFRVKFLGDKWPTIDFYVEVRDNTGAFCFIQVKSSIRGYEKIGSLKKYLLVTVRKKHIENLIKINAPTYVIGLDYVKSDYFKSRAFIYSVDANNITSISKIPVKNVLNEKKLLELKKEVIQYWKKTNAYNNKQIHLTKFKR